MPETRVLGFDYGLKKIGVAVGQTLTASATPLKIIPTVKRGQPDWNVVAELIRDWQPNALIVGIPYNMDGSEHDLTKAARKFERELVARFKLPVHGVDERLTTVEAQESRGKASRDEVDHHAAAVIVTDWLRRHG